MMRRLTINMYMIVAMSIAVLLIVGPMVFACIVGALLLAEIAVIAYRYAKCGTLAPGNLLLSGLLEYDDIMGFNLTREYANRKLWKGSDRIRKNLDKYTMGFGCDVSTNSLRYRGRLLPKKKDSNVYRIVVLGDSTTFGFLNDDRYTWPDFLERKLNQLSNGTKRYEVMNLAVGGYKFEQNVQRYLRDFLDYDVDAIINACIVNDFKYSVIHEERGYNALNKTSERAKRIFSRGKVIHMMMYVWRKSFLRLCVTRLNGVLRRLLSYIHCCYSCEYHADEISRKPGEYSVDLTRYLGLYKDSCWWLKSYSRSFTDIYDKVKARHPLCKFYSVSSPVVMSDADFYNDPTNYALPESLSLRLKNGTSYDFSSPEVVEHHARYLAHSELFKRFLVNISKDKDDCHVVMPFNSICAVPLEDRGDIFYDVYHLTNYGCFLFAGDIARAIWNDINIGCDHQPVGENDENKN